MTALVLASTHVGHDAGHHATGHPLWHYLIIAIGAIAVFLAIIVHEHIQAHTRRRAKPSSI